jgi:uncharacterized protein with PIN domain/prolyl-tRNA editing enzyme YbaK/EbsC (Cys-tRNA(Pro) deacylase)/predicted GNAT family N-acyltransferase
LRFSAPALLAETLGRVFSERRIVCVGRGVCDDIAHVIRAAGIRLKHSDVRIFDLGVVCDPVGGSLSQVAERWLNRPLAKDLQVSDWNARPLSFASLSYAALDALAAARAATAARGQHAVIAEVWRPQLDVASAMTLTEFSVTLFGPAIIADALDALPIPFAGRVSHSRSPQIEGGSHINTIGCFVDDTVPVIAIVDSSRAVELGRLAAAAGGGSARLATAAELAREFGFAPKCLPPFGLRAHFRAFIDVLGAPPLIAGGGGDDFFTVFADTAALLGTTHGEAARISTTRASAQRSAPAVADAPPINHDDAGAVAISTFAPLSRPRFVVDSSLNRLMRWLRAIGVDCEAKDGFASKAWRLRRGDHRTDALSTDELIAFANEDRRIILTRDSKTMARRVTGVLYWCNEVDITDLFTQVSDDFVLTVKPEDLMSRCSACNNDEYRRIEPEHVRTLDVVVSEHVLTRMTHFWQCTRDLCGKVFWEGGRFDDTRDRYGELFAPHTAAAVSEASWVICEVSTTDTHSLSAIGCLRVQVWAAEECLDSSLFPTGEWVDAEDTAPTTRHFVAQAETGEIVAAARLVCHASPASTDSDVAVFVSSGVVLDFPVFDLGRLVVRADFRRRGIASALNVARCDAARSAGARAIISTASADNARLLRRIGFASIGESISFSDRPGVVFDALWIQIARLTTTWLSSDAIMRWSRTLGISRRAAAALCRDVSLVAAGVRTAAVAACAPDPAALAVLVAEARCALGVYIVGYSIFVCSAPAVRAQARDFESAAVDEGAPLRVRAVNAARGPREFSDAETRAWCGGLAGALNCVAAAIEKGRVDTFDADCADAPCAVALTGALLGYPVVYDAGGQSEGANALGHVPLLVFSARISAPWLVEAADEAEIAFSVPSSFGASLACVDSWREGVAARVRECGGTCSFSKKIVMSGLVAL